MSREGGQVREGTGKALQPELRSDWGTLSPQHVLECAAAYGDGRPRIPAPGRPCSTENPTLLKMNQELSRWWTSVSNTHPRSVGLEEDGEGGWVALFMLCWWADLSHTWRWSAFLPTLRDPGVHSSSNQSARRAQTSVWLECAVL